MKVLFATSEISPFSRAGGLADVSHDLTVTLAGLGHHISVVTPKYRQVRNAGIPLEPVPASLEVPISWMKKPARVFSSVLDRQVTVYFIERDDLYDREGLYGNEFGDYQDNAERFIFFSRAAVELCRALDLRPDVIHGNDWQTGLIPVYLKSLYAEDPALKSVATLFTIHNLGYQGLFWHYDLHLTGLGWEYFTPSALEFFGKLNLLKGGIVFADLLNTVSPTYRKEILTPAYGFGLDGLLRSREKDLHAVLNGVNYRVWDPAHDPHIAAPYTKERPENKKVCKAQLQEIFQLKKRPDIPIIAVISRLLDRKGLDLIGRIFPRLMDLQVEVVFMGEGAETYHSWVREVKERYPQLIGVVEEYQGPMAHRIQAGADMLLMPSQYEPCGLEQMVALRYGTIPIVRAVGGLEDTVEDYQAKTNQGTGFKFKEYEGEKLLQALQQAVGVYRDKPRWKRLMERAMERDFSWEHSAAAYQGLYEKAVGKKRKQTG
jgi:starch synthase